MEIHQLRYFVEVVRTGNFTRAAERCHVTQPTLSHQIKKLEAELNEPLLQRRRNGATLTPFGERFHPRAQRILRELLEAQEEAEAFTGEVRGSLRLGAIPTVAPYSLPGLLREASKRFPLLHFEISEEPTDELLDLLRRGALDLALVSPPITGDEWVFQPLCNDELLVTLPADHPLSRAETVTIEQLVAHPLVLMKETHCLRGQTLQLCRRAAVAPEVSIQSSQLDTVLAMVELGLGISLTPKMALPFLGHREVVFRSLGPSPFCREIAFVWPQQASRTHALRAFLEMAAKATT